MKVERSNLAKSVFPYIRTVFAMRGISFSEVDLRWGITEEAETPEIIAACLREVLFPLFVWFGLVFCSVEKSEREQRPQFFQPSSFIRPVSVVSLRVWS